MNTYHTIKFKEGRRKSKIEISWSIELLVIRTTSANSSVCCLHIKPFFLLNDISTPSVRADSSS